jgi:hypothetical protein
LAGVSLQAASIGGLLLPLRAVTRAFSSEVDAGSREENASKED